MRDIDGNLYAVLLDGEIIRNFQLASNWCVLIKRQERIDCLIGFRSDGLGFSVRLIRISNDAVGLTFVKVGSQLSIPRLNTI